MQQTRIGQFAAAADLQDRLNVFFRQKAGFNGHLRECRVAPEALHKVVLNLDQFADLFDHVNRDANGSGVVDNIAADGLFDPPGGVGAEAKTLGRVELLDGLEQAHVAFLDQVHHANPPAAVAFGDADDEAKVKFDVFFCRPFRDLIHLSEIVAPDFIAELFRRLQPKMFRSGL